jgi:hypothetical protein
MIPDSILRKEIHLKLRLLNHSLQVSYQLDVKSCKWKITMEVARNKSKPWCIGICLVSRLVSHDAIPAFYPYQPGTD